MRNKFFAAATVCAILIITGCGPKPRPAAESVSADPAAAPTGDSGVYGISGARVADGAPEGVIGECVWIFDADDRHQVAKGECAEPEPGKFRIALKPGRYVLHGPGGIRPIEIQSGVWVKVMSLVDLPMSP
jgi:hypothetical protein